MFPSQLKSRQILITDTNAAGGSFLARLLGELGLDLPENAEPCGDPASSPYIVQSANEGGELRALLARGGVQIDHVLVPIRSLDDGADPETSPRRSRGSATRPAQLENFHALVATLVAHEIPHTFLHYPRFIWDSAYAFQQLQPLLGTTSRPFFEDCFARVPRTEAPDRALRPELEGTEADGSRKKFPTRKARAVFRRPATWLAATAMIASVGWWAPHPAASPAASSTATAVNPVSTAAGTPAPLPSFQSAPLHVSQSLKLAALEWHSAPWFPPSSEPTVRLHRPRRISVLFFRPEMRPPEFRTQ